MKLIVWLGNPWKQYEKTRHNIGFVVLDTLIEKKDVIFLKPQTFMNLSGEAVSKIANFYKITPENILIIHDEIDLPTGKIQLKLGWSSAGHNWLKSIIEKLWTKDFRRLRIGVDRPATKEQVADYVLSNFTSEERKKITLQQEEIESLINEFLSK